MNSLSRLLLMMCAYLLMGSGIAQAQYTTLGVPGASETAAFGISGNNIVGQYIKDGLYHGFLYDGSQYTTPYVSGSFETIARSISGHNIVGEYYDNGSLRAHGYLYDGNHYTTLDVPGAVRTFAYGISGNKIVGSYDNGEGTYSDRGYLYDGSRYILLDVPGAFRTFANGISGGKIVGSYYDGSYSHGFLYDGSHYTSLDVPGSLQTAVAGIEGNNIVGQYVDSVGSHGFLYDGNNYTTLDVPGASYTAAFGISGNNIVGVYVDGVGTHGFLFKPIALSLSNVTASNFTLTSATITWNTNVSANSVVEYGFTDSYGQAASAAPLTTGHSITLTGLVPFNLYHYRIRSTTATGQTDVSEDHTFVATNQATLGVSYRNLRRDAFGNYLLDLSFTNQEGITITQVHLGYATLGTAAAPTSPVVPYTLTTPIPNGTSQTVTLAFPATSGSRGTYVMLRVAGSADTFNRPGHIIYNASFRGVLLP